jgi:hypothetical protein
MFARRRAREKGQPRISDPGSRHLGILAALVAGVLLASPLASQAHQPAREPPRIGVLVFTPMATIVQEAFRQGFRDHGYVEGQNIRVEWRSAEWQTDRANAMAAELVRLKVNLIVAEFTPAVQAAKTATQTIPIVMASAGRSRRDRARRGPRAPRRKCDRHLDHRCGALGQAVRAHPGTSPRCHASGAVGPWGRSIGQGVRRGNSEGSFERCLGWRRDASAP